jgi:hypothetical protein
MYETRCKIGVRHVPHIAINNTHFQREIRSQMKAYENSASKLIYLFFWIKKLSGIRKHTLHNINFLKFINTLQRSGIKISDICKSGIPLCVIICKVIILLKIGGWLPEMKKISLYYISRRKKHRKEHWTISVDVYSSCWVINGVVIFQAHIMYVLKFSLHIYELRGHDCSRSSSSCIPESSIKVRINCGITIT